MTKKSSKCQTKSNSKSDECHCDTEPVGAEVCLPDINEVFIQRTLPRFYVRCSKLSLLHDPIYVCGDLNNLSDELVAEEECLQEDDHYCSDEDCPVHNKIQNSAKIYVGVQIEITVDTDCHQNPFDLYDPNDLCGEMHLIIDGKPIQFNLLTSDSKNDASDITTLINNNVLKLTYVTDADDFQDRIKNICDNKFRLCFDDITLGSLHHCQAHIDDSTLHAKISFVIIERTKNEYKCNRYGPKYQYTLKDCIPLVVCINQ
jgi:hypothetical protein